MVGTVHLPSSVIMNIAASTEFLFPFGSIDAPSKSGFNQVKEPSHPVTRIFLTFVLIHGLLGGREKSDFPIGWVRRQMADTGPKSERSFSWKWKD